MTVRMGLLISTALSALTPAAGWAQTPEGGSAAQVQPSSEASTTAGDPADADASGVGDIVVTANRRSENLQNVPISIAAFKGETLVRLGIQSTNDLPQITPGLSQTRVLGGVNAFLRGVGTTSAGYSTEVPVATYFDGLYLPNSSASAFSFNNIERIEILKGPQGTLYGRNTTGGLIHVITRDPGQETSVDVSASYANYNTTQLNFYGSTPLSETFAVNFAALYINQADGWGKNLFIGNDIYKFKDYGFQGKLKWTPTPDTKVTLAGFYDNTDTNQGNSSFIFPGSIGADGSVFVGRFNSRSRIDPFLKQRQYSVSLKVEQNLGFANLTSTTGYIDNRSPGLSVQTANFGNPVNGQGATFLGGLQTAKTFSQELQLASNTPGSAFSWIVGSFYYRDNTYIGIDVYGTCVAGVCARSTPVHSDGYQYTRSISGYADGTYNITDTTKLTLGLRYTSDNKTLRGLVTPLAGQANSVAALPASPAFDTRLATFPTSTTFGKLTYRAVLQQELAPDINLYASYNRGFKSGGYNPTSFANPPARPEVLDAFEIGFKARTQDRVLQLNASAFYYDYQDIQGRTTAGAPAGSTILFNAAKAHIKGLDVDAILAPAPGLTFTGAMELLDARYVSFPTSTCSTPRVPNGTTILGGYAIAPCDVSGRRLPSAPKFSYTLGVNYSFDTSIGGFELNATDGFKSHYFWEPNNRLRQNAFHVLNAAITFTPAHSNFSVQAFGRNLADEFYFSGAGDGSGGNDTYSAAAPRTYGVKVRYHF